MQLSRKQFVLIILVTLSWGLNWPMMKMGVTDYPPLTFRAICLWIGVPVLWLALVLMKVPFHVARKDYRELFWLALTNMFVWHVLIILALSVLSSGRAAILGYTMPVFSALLGVAFFGAQMRPAQWLGVGAAAAGIAGDGIGPAAVGDGLDPPLRLLQRGRLSGHSGGQLPRQQVRWRRRQAGFAGWAEATGGS